jgi:hypothetical protein
VRASFAEEQLAGFYLLDCRTTLQPVGIPFRVPPEPESENMTDRQLRAAGS